MNPSPSAGPDVGQLRAENLPSAAFPGGRDQPFRVFFAPDVHPRLWKHAEENLGVEVCGVLVGAWGRDADGAFVSVTEAIRGEAAASKFAEVTFTHETWAKINHEMDTKFAKLSIVGWYHTHPDFGVFLSDRDVFIQQHFFAGAGQIAHVLDPVRKTEGVFVWKAGKPALAPHYWVGDRIQLGGGPRPDQETPPAAAGGADRPAAPPPLVDWSAVLNYLMPILSYLAVFLLGYLLAGRLSDRERLLTLQDARAHAAFWLGVKPGLREALEREAGHANALLRDADALAAAHAKADAEMADEQKEQWRALRAGLAKTRGRLRELQLLFCLTEAETEQMMRYAAHFVAGELPNVTKQQRAQLMVRLDKVFQEAVKAGLFELPAEAKPAPLPGAEKEAPPAAAKDAPAGK